MAPKRFTVLARKEEKRRGREDAAVGEALLNLIFSGVLDPPTNRRSSLDRPARTTIRASPTRRRDAIAP